MNMFNANPAIKFTGKELILSIWKRSLGKYSNKQNLNALNTDNLIKNSEIYLFLDKFLMRNTGYGKANNVKYLWDKWAKYTAMLDIAHAGAKYGLSISQVATNGFVAFWSESQRDNWMSWLWKWAKGRWTGVDVEKIKTQKSLIYMVNQQSYLTFSQAGISHELIKSLSASIQTGKDSRDFCSTS